MIKKWLHKRKEKKLAHVQLLKAKEYYKNLQCGQLFIDYIRKDLEKMNKNQMNRHQRRRFEKDLIKKGILTNEIYQHYATKIDQVNDYIKNQLNPPKVKKPAFWKKWFVKKPKKDEAVDGKEFYNNLKKQEKAKEDTKNDKSKSTT